MTDLLARIGRREVVLADGALGTLLIEHGLTTGACPEEFVLSRPGALREIARAYLEAGAELIQTNTFGGSPAKLVHYGLAARAAELNARAVQLVRDAVGQRASVLGVIGPTGRLLQPYGDAAPEELSSGFALQIRALIEAGADALSIETMTDLNEAVLAVAAARAIAPRAPVLAALTFERTPRGFFTIMGASVADAAARLQQAGADVVGANCGAGSDVMVEIAAQFARCTKRPLVIQPNAGLPQLVAGRPVHPESPSYMAERVEALLGLGVGVVGGCCGTTPQHIRAFRDIVDRWNQHNRLSNC